MEAVAILILVIFVVILAVLQSKSHERKIYEKIHSIGGEVLSIEKKVFSTGPFLVLGRGRTVYRIEYKIGNMIKEGWVKFGDLYGPDWRL